MDKNKIDKYELIIFDLDGTLAPSKSQMEADMAELMVRLLEKRKIAVISGGGYIQFETQFLRSWPNNYEKFSNLYLLPTSGTQLYVWKGAWCSQYIEHLTAKEKEKIMVALNEALKMSGYVKPEIVYGSIIEDRGSQITFSGVGQHAPIDVKSKWDPDRTKREKIDELLSKKIPEFDIHIGGMTSVDITKRGVNKAYGIRKLEDFLHLTAEKILFVGDALFPDGNDYPAKATGVDCIQVADPNETKGLITKWLE